MRDDYDLLMAKLPEANRKRIEESVQQTLRERADRLDSEPVTYQTAVGQEPEKIAA